MSFIKKGTHYDMNISGFEPIDFSVNYPTTKLSSEDYLTFLSGLFEDMLKLIEAKNSDYTGGKGAFANFDKAAELGLDPMVGVLLRMEDKFQRIKSFVTQGDLKVKSESIEDAFKDIIGYSSICLGMLEQDKRGQSDD